MALFVWFLESKAAEEWLVLADLTGRAGVIPLEEETRSWQLVLSTNEKRFAGDETPASARPGGRVLRKG